MAEPMLSVVIETHNHEDALARTLASLVSAAVEGVVREVIICDGGSSDRTHDVAEHAGCRYLADADAQAGIGQARSEWVLLLEPGSRMMDGWMEAAIAHTGEATGPARFSRATLSRQSWLQRLFGPRKPLAEGLLITRKEALSLAGGAGSSDGIAGAVSSRRINGHIIVASTGRAASAQPGC